MSIVINNSSRKFISDVIGKRINSPEQRLIQGVTALAIQPIIDYNNHKADKETRAISVARTIGKIIAGTLTGVAIRYGSIALTKKFSQYKIQETIIDKGLELVKKVEPKSNKDIFMPKIDFETPILTAEKFAEKHDNHIKALGTIAACVTMIFTNFLIDAPLTKLITKWLTPSVHTQLSKENMPEVNKNE